MLIKNAKFLYSRILWGNCASGYYKQYLIYDIYIINSNGQIGVGSSLGPPILQYITLQNFLLDWEF